MAAFGVSQNDEYTVDTHIFELHNISDNISLPPINHFSDSHAFDVSLLY